MMRSALLAFLALTSSATAQDHPVAIFDRFDLRSDLAADSPAQENRAADPATASADWWQLTDGKLAISASREPLWSARPTFLEFPVDGQDFSATALLDYAELAAGDVAGLVARQDADQWISIQVERIEPADLVAVRVRAGKSSPPAGKLVFTTALPGTFKQRVKLRIDADDGRYRLLFAQENGLWQIVAEDVTGPFPPAAPDAQPPAISVGPFATDGADRLSAADRH
ncbi:regulation of enolase protein 1 (concanavalin A-like superfamily) [Altererythrobacter atlanticus]|uniref:Uncharacterized protein n=1 Tax=Croceibacterium atlanticum TaxID=1267766 RepID=A0A0F7KRY9_9SPHN|nr:hypothetical protein [Croceibacterium atlanticum]AKH43223.1 hypothetical protein WYH_02190 [Croceibacterium atlanticum]MBB5732072.1 regulation of enolase protein 1 (concanavalin A-like superfamily) [Croceibacterium atlanticum]